MRGGTAPQRGADHRVTPVPPAASLSRPPPSLPLGCGRRSKRADGAGGAAAAAARRRAEKAIFSRYIFYESNILCVSAFAWKSVSAPSAGARDSAWDRALGAGRSASPAADPTRPCWGSTAPTRPAAQRCAPAPAVCRRRWCTHTHTHARTPPPVPFPSCLCTWELNRLSKHREQTAPGFAWARVGLSSAKRCPDGRRPRLQSTSLCNGYGHIAGPHPHAMATDTSWGRIPINGQIPVPWGWARHRATSPRNGHIPLPRVWAHRGVTASAPG